MTPGSPSWRRCWQQQAWLVAAALPRSQCEPGEAASTYTQGHTWGTPAASSRRRGPRAWTSSSFPSAVPSELQTTPCQAPRACPGTLQKVARGRWHVLSLSSTVQTPDPAWCIGAATPTPHRALGDPGPMPCVPQKQMLRALPAPNHCPRFPWACVRLKWVQGAHRVGLKDPEPRWFLPVLAHLL